MAALMSCLRDVSLPVYPRNGVVDPLSVLKKGTGIIYTQSWVSHNSNVQFSSDLEKSEPRWSVFPQKFDLDCIQLQLIRPLSMKSGSKDALMRMLKLCGLKSLSSYADPVCTKHSSSCAIMPWPNCGIKLIS